MNSFTGFGWLICPLTLLLGVGAIYFFWRSRSRWQDEFKRILDYAVLSVFFALLWGFVASLKSLGFVENSLGTFATEVFSFLAMLSVFFCGRKTLEFSKKTFGDNK